MNIEDYKDFFVENALNLTFHHQNKLFNKDEAIRYIGYIGGETISLWYQPNVKKYFIRHGLKRIEDPMCFDILNRIELIRQFNS